MDCSICYNVVDTTTNNCTLSCSHSFHLRCMMKWMDKAETCPLCRMDIPEEEEEGSDNKTYRNMNGILIAEEDIIKIQELVKVSRGLAIRAIQNAVGDLDEAYSEAKEMRYELIDTPLTAEPEFSDEPTDEQRAYWGLQWLFGEKESIPSYLSAKELRARHMHNGRDRWTYDDWSSDLSVISYFTYD